MNNFLSNKVNSLKNRMDKLVKSKGFGKFIPVAQVLFLTLVLSTQIAFATADFGTLTSLIVTWTTRIGGLVAFIGAVMFALGWRNDDPGEMIKGGKTCISGIMIIAIAQGAGAWLN